MSQDLRQRLCNLIPYIPPPCSARSQFQDDPMMLYDYVDESHAQWERQLEEVMQLSHREREVGDSMLHSECCARWEAHVVVV